MRLHIAKRLFRKAAGVCAVVSHVRLANIHSEALFGFQVDLLLCFCLLFMRPTFGFRGLNYSRMIFSREMFNIIVLPILLPDKGIKLILENADNDLKIMPNDKFLVGLLDIG